MRLSSRYICGNNIRMPTLRLTSIFSALLLAALRTAAATVGDDGGQEILSDNGSEIHVQSDAASRHGQPLPAPGDASEVQPESLVIRTSPASYGWMKAPTLPQFSYTLRSSGAIAAWDSGALLGTASAESLPGLMGIERGGVAMTHSAGAFSMTAYGEAVKYGFFGGLRTSWGFGGSLTYEASERLSFTLFGSYYSRVGPMAPAMAGYVSIPTIGGYADWRISDRWGVQAGAQAYRSMMTGRWEAQPIVAPYYRLSPNSRISVDVGGILYQLLRNNSGSMRRSNPTLGPDIPSINDRF